MFFNKLTVLVMLILLASSNVYTFEKESDFRIKYQILNNPKLKNAILKLKQVKIQRSSSVEFISGYEVAYELLEKNKFDPIGNNADNQQQLKNFFAQFKTIKEQDQITIVIFSLSLFTEKNRLTKWSLADFGTNELSFLFKDELKNQFGVDNYYKQYVLAHKLLRSAMTEEEAIFNIVSWLSSSTGLNFKYVNFVKPRTDAC